MGQSGLAVNSGHKVIVDITCERSHNHSGAMSPSRPIGRLSVL